MKMSAARRNRSTRTPRGSRGTYPTGHLLSFSPRRSISPRAKQASPPPADDEWIGRTRAGAPFARPWLEQPEPLRHIVVPDEQTDQVAWFNPILFRKARARRVRPRPAGSIALGITWIGFGARGGTQRRCSLTRLLTAITLACARWLQLLDRLVDGAEGSPSCCDGRRGHLGNRRAFAARLPR